MTAVPGHFVAWMTLLGAGITLITSIATATVSNIFANRRDATTRAHADQTQRMMWEHERQVRFHDDRFAAYAEFIGAATYIGASALSWLDRGTPNRLLEFPGFDVVTYGKSLARVFMLAKPDAYQKANAVNEIVGQVTFLNPKSVATARDLIEKLSVASNEFEASAKKELGID